MTWAKLDDQLHGHRKARKAWRLHRGALGLHLLALSYSAGQLTDGLIDDEFVDEKLPVAKEREQITGALVEAGLWERVDDGWQINDWLDYNPSRADVLDRRRRDAERKARGRRGDSDESPNGVRADTSRSPRGVSRVHAHPDPTRPIPTTAPLPPTGGRTRDRVRYEQDLATFAAEHFPDVDAGYVGHYASQLRSRRQEPTVEALRPLLAGHATGAAA